MPMSSAFGQGSGDFRETSARIQAFNTVIRNSLGVLTADAFTQTNPPIVTTTANVSTQLTGITKRGVLGASIAFTRPDTGGGNGYHGGPVQVSSAYVAGQKPLGLFINDSLGNPFENTPGVASGRGPYYCGGGTFGVSLWETQTQIGASTALTYAAGDRLYASVNGFLTNRYQDSYEYQVVADLDNVTVMGVVKVAPDANNSLLVFDLRI